MPKRVSRYVERRARCKAEREEIPFRFALYLEWRRVNRMRRFHARTPGLNGKR